MGKEEKQRMGLRSAYKRRWRANRTAEKWREDNARQKDYARLDCYGKYGAAVSQYEILLMYRRCLPAGSLRLKIFDNEVKEARKRERLPGDASKVMEEICVRLATVSKESSFQTQSRLDKEMHQLEMGRKSHGEFRANWEELLENMTDAKMDCVNSERSLYNWYVTKLTEKLRDTVLCHPHILDGDGSAPRMPKTWEEVADAVEIYLDSRLDVRVPVQDNVKAIEDRKPGGGGGGGRVNAVQEGQLCRAAKELPKGPLPAMPPGSPYAYDMSASGCSSVRRH